MFITEGLGLTKFSENKDAAKKFIEWYTSADMREKFYGNLYFLPGMDL